MTVTRLPIVGVMGSSERDNADLAVPLGRMLAGLPVHLLTGAGQATMKAVCKAFVSVKDRAGLCVGIAPAASLEHPGKPRAGYPNEFVELPILTHLVAKQPELWDGLTRNHINILTSQAIIALPGGRGTAHEIELAVRFGRPVASFFREPDEMGPLPEVVRLCPDLGAARAFVVETLGLEID